MSEARETRRRALSTRAQTCTRLAWQRASRCAPCPDTSPGAARSDRRPRCARSWGRGARRRAARAARSQTRPKRDAQQPGPRTRLRRRPRRPPPLAAAPQPPAAAQSQDELLGGSLKRSPATRLSGTRHGTHTARMEDTWTHLQAAPQTPTTLALPAQPSGLRLAHQTAVEQATPSGRLLIATDEQSMRVRLLFDSSSRTGSQKRPPLHAHPPQTCYADSRRRCAPTACFRP